jgi:radical SAM superfamily enzyme YgiQ (UPF0313 family)
MSDIILIYPSLTQGKNPHGSILPLCFAWIAALLEENDISVRIVDYQIEDVDLATLLQEENPLCVGVSGTTQSRFDSFEVIEAVKSIDAKIITLYGGPHATPAAEDTLTHVRGLDAVVRNEGELTTLEIMQRLKRDRKIDYSKIAGVSFREHGAVVHTPSRSHLKNLDDLPPPAWHLYKLDHYQQNLEYLNVPAHVMLTSRGCPFNCSFCSARLLWGNRYATRSAGSVADELQYMADKHSVQGFKIFDSTFTVNRKHVLSICRELKKRGLDNLPWECEIRADTVDRELLKTMKDAGCYYVDMGLESASPRVLKQICKGVSLQQVENVIGWCNEIDLMVKLFLTWGHPTETYQEALETYRFTEKYRSRVHRFSSHVGIMIYPGTGVESYARDHGLLPADFCWSKPYYNRSNLNLGSDPTLPLLIQPQLNFKHLARVYYKIRWKPLLNLPNMLKKFWECITHKNLRRRHVTTLIEFCNQMFNLHIRTNDHQQSLAQAPSRGVPHAPGSCGGR